MRFLPKLSTAIALLTLVSPIADAASLQVAPTTIEMLAPDSAGMLNLHNDGKAPIQVQVRVFRWSQKGGIETLEPTAAVVASPPHTRLAPNADYVVRVVRVSKSVVKAEESYRLVVDEVPDPSRLKAGTVALVVRQSIPVFFRNPAASGPEVSWKLKKNGSSLMLVAQNKGASRLRLADIGLSQDGKTIASSPGLVGYVLGGATMQWPLGGANRLSGSNAKLSGASHLGPIDAQVAVGR
ncbi:fimbria/pilus periplasmic chaperone [Mesorhizobium sp. NBSH29]|uniref:fimbrial biogenesis chaperone n=1 Tax=Mesorhizobium sp. NBSH29 TaxID=2654249 RepID=UPI0018966ED5|nr:molecular chaperone [Mesorhizobium sp. NBSH29]QPC85641.1 fimbria/pilus periplasmic chaperone [Mesorhizobium sp. NBSH29]